MFTFKHEHAAMADPLPHQVLRANRSRGVAFACVFAVSFAASAQRDDGTDSSRDGDPVLEEVVVYGEKDTRSLQDTLSSVGVVSAKDIEDTGVLDFKEAFRLVANVRDGSGLENGFVIRGINSEGIGLSNGGTPLASLYIDGAVQTPSGSRRGARGLWDIEQIEVLRGPQSTLSGRNSLAGAIQIVSKDPTYDHEGALRVSTDDQNFREWAIVQSGPILQDQFAARLSHQSVENDTLIDFQNLDLDQQPNKGEYQQTRLKLLLEPRLLPKFAARYTGALSTDEPGAPTVTSAGGFDFEDRVNRGNFEFRETEVQNHTLQLTYEINDKLKLTSQSTISDDETDRAFFVFVPSSGRVEQRTDGQIEFSNIAHELRLNYEQPGGRTRGVLGAFIFEQDLLNSTTAQFISGQSTLFGADIVEKNRAIFGQFDWAINDKWTVTVGGRYDEGEFTGSLFSGDPQNPIERENPDSDYSVFLPKFGVQYYITEDVSVGATYQEGFRAGGAGITQNTVFFYDPESTRSYELALRSMWLDSRLRLNANAFFTDWVDQQITVQVSEFPGDEITENLGGSEMAGAEFELQFAFTPELTLAVSAGLLRTRITRARSSNQAIGESAGDSFSEAPERTASFNLNYRHPNGFFFSVDSESTEEYFSRIPNNPLNRIDRYFVLNARAGYEWASGKVTLQVDNAFDRTYLLGVDEFGTGVLGLPRTVGLTATLYW
ncbi:MAG: TonB-dependent receptor [Pseudomonadota bacterium]